jgi:hypothetical protein
MKIVFMPCFILIGVIYSFAQEKSSSIQKQIVLPDGFKIELRQAEQYDLIETYTSLTLYHHNKLIYKDTLSQTDYEFGDTLYPMFHKLKSTTFELLIEINNRPSKNILARFIIQKDRLLKRDTLPTFFCNAKNLDFDNALEYAAFWDYGEVWIDSNQQKVTSYNPILYYELTSKGLELDSALTIAKNKSIYGAFYGYEYNNTIPIPLSVIGNQFTDELKRIEEKK